MVNRIAGWILCAIFFASGAAALVFESLWFRQAGLAFGNSVWASTVVLSSFMAGIALGNALAVRFGTRIQNPVRFYAFLEAAVATSGAILVWILPDLGKAIGPWLGTTDGSPTVLNLLRFGVGFCLLVIPATAMGATLPILVKALRRWDPDFGGILGRLYGFNTLGAVLGALAAETVLVSALGVRGTALAAGGLYLTAGAIALLIHRFVAESESAEAQPEAEEAPADGSLGRAWAFALSSFLAGFILLAFEVVWFRFVRLFIDPNPRAFSLMLAVVLSGIGLGGFLAGLVLRRFPRADRFAPLVACAAGALAVFLYVRFATVLAPLEQVYIQGIGEVLRLSVELMAPVSLLSGFLFTLTGTAIHRELGSDVRATGFLSFANTLGGMTGSIAGAFLFLPFLGIEKSFFVLAAGYALVAALLLATRASGSGLALHAIRIGAAGALGFALWSFPFGSMNDHYLQVLASRYGYPAFATIEGGREGRSESVKKPSTETGQEPPYQRLVTGSFSMASNQILDRRYMKLFVYWPLALAPESRDALLISYGVGSTAKALTDSASLSRIDVVDISREVTDMSEISFPDPADHPLRDPRVELHIEDGRYFLQTTDRRYDLITSEPPPPKHAGVVNLYTREYFQLMFDRLNEGGINTYWLPVHLLTEGETRSIIKAYCDVFENCSLWGGFGYSWMLAGVREPKWGITEEEFSRQWNDPVVNKELRTLGVEIPEQLGALFMADAAGLAKLIEGADPVTDDYPKRLTDEVTTPADFRWYRSLMKPAENARAFEASELIRKAWPEDLRQKSLDYFWVQDMIDTQFGMTRGLLPIDKRIRALHRIQSQTPLRDLSLWHMGIKGDVRPKTAADHALRALAERDYAEATRLYQLARQLSPEDPQLERLESFSLCMSGELRSFGITAERCGGLERVVARSLPEEKQE